MMGAMPTPPVYEVRFRGELDPAAGVALTDFHFPWREDEAPATEFRAVHDGGSLVFCFDVVDPDIVLEEAADPGEAAMGSDRVELFFAPAEDLRPEYFGAEMDPLGRIHDFRARFHRQFDFSWSFRSLKVQGEIDEGGYSVFGSVAMEELSGLGCLRDGEMVVGVYRAEFSRSGEEIRHDWISWVRPDSPTPDFHIPSSFGRFRFLPPES